jgi:hypothetical protein
MKKESIQGIECFPHSSLIPLRYGTIVSFKCEPLRPALVDATGNARQSLLKIPSRISVPATYGMMGHLARL